MSLLMFIHEPDSVMIVTDTLATTVDGEAFMFQSKAWALPHLNMAVAVTGVANLGAAWNELLRTSAVVQDLRMIDLFAPEQLRRLWRTLQEEAPSGAIPATIYHFGFEVGSGRAVRYVYRSTNNFESERIEESGFGLKPAPKSFELVQPDSLDDILALALKVRAEQDALTAAERIFIGGELHLMIVRDGLTQTRRIHRFADYEAAWREMVERLDRDQPSADGQPRSGSY